MFELCRRLGLDRPLMSPYALVSPCVMDRDDLNQMVADQVDSDGESMNYPPVEEEEFQQLRGELMDADFGEGADLILGGLLGMRKVTDILFYCDIAHVFFLVFSGLPKLPRLPSRLQQLPCELPRLPSRLPRLPKLPRGLQRLSSELSRLPSKLTRIPMIPSGLPSGLRLNRQRAAQAAKAAKQAATAAMRAAKAAKQTAKDAKAATRASTAVIRALETAKQADKDANDTQRAAKRAKTE
jgi:hypothetical protein